MAINQADTVMGKLSPNLLKKAASKLKSNNITNTGIDTSLGDFIMKPIEAAISPSKSISPTNVSMGAPKVDPISANIQANPTYKTPAQIMNNGVNMVNPAVSEAEKEAQMWGEKQKAAAEMEAARRRTAAENLYNQTMYGLNSEKAAINPQYEETIKTIADGGFKRAEAQKELGNMYGWTLASSGLEQGLQNTIGLETEESKNRATIQRDQALADIARRLTLAEQLKNSSNADADAWKAAQTMGVEADAFLKAKELARQDAETKRKNMIENEELNIKKGDFTIRQDNNKYNQRINEENNYIKSITGLGDGFDYSAAIKAIQDDGDPSNDWKISPLMQQREVKKDNMAQDFLSTIGQYSNDYQQAINDLNPNDPIYDKKLAYLKTNQAAKKAAMIAAQKTDAASKQKMYFDLFKETGIASTPEMAAALGIKQGTTTMDYKETQYNTGKPYYSPNASQPKVNTNANFSNVYTNIKNMSVADAVNELKSGAADYIEAFGESGYRNLWNTVLRDAIQMGQAEPMQATPTKPKQKNDISSLIPPEMLGNLSPEEKAALGLK